MLTQIRGHDAGTSLRASACDSPKPSFDRGPFAVAVGEYSAVAEGIGCENRAPVGVLEPNELHVSTEACLQPPRNRGEAVGCRVVHRDHHIKVRIGSTVAPGHRAEQHGQADARFCAQAAAQVPEQSPVLAQVVLLAERCRETAGALAPAVDETLSRCPPYGSLRQVEVSSELCEGSG